LQGLRGTLTTVVAVTGLVLVTIIFVIAVVIAVTFSTGVSVTVSVTVEVGVGRVIVVFSMPQHEQMELYPTVPEQGLAYGGT